MRNLVPLLIAPPRVGISYCISLKISSYPRTFNVKFLDLKDIYDGIYFIGSLSGLKILDVE